MVVVARCSCTLCYWIRQCTAWTASTSHCLAVANSDWLKSLPRYLWSTSVATAKSGCAATSANLVFMSLIISFSLSAALSSAHLIPMTRGITSVAADDSVLTSLVARVRWVWIDWSLTAHRMTVLWTQLHPSSEHKPPELPVWRPFNDYDQRHSPTLTALVVRPNKINYVFLCCITGARLNGHEWTIKTVFILCAMINFCKCDKLAVP